MRYNAGEQQWIEISEEEEEALINTLAELRNFRELTAREAGNQLSNDIELI